jgi:hypothetical protein
MNDTNIDKAKKRTPRNRPGQVVELSPELLEFVNSPVPTTEIAARYGISPATLTVRAKRAGLPLRKRGRHLSKEPTPLQRKILALAAVHGCQVAALRFNLSKQRVNKLQHRWNAWMAANTDHEPKANRRRKTNRYLIRFHLGPDSFDQLKKLLQHPWFSRLESTNRAAREIVNIFLSGQIRGVKSSWVVTH